MPSRLVEWQSTLKRKDLESDEAPGIVGTTNWEDVLSGQETEPDESMEQPTGRRLTAAPPCQLGLSTLTERQKHSMR